MPEKRDVDDECRYKGCILCQRELAAPVQAYYLQTRTATVMICAPCYDQNVSVLPRLKEMRNDYMQHNPIMGDPDESKWTECPHTCSGWCGDMGCQRPCMYKGNHKWENQTKVQKVCWCGIDNKKVADNMVVEEDEESTRDIVPLKDVQTMRDRVRFRKCTRFGTVPLMHYCEYCSPDDEPQPLPGGLSYANQPSSSSSQHPLVT